MPGRIGILCLTAGLVYLALGIAAHRALATNAFDLSVFDYALWTTASGGPLAYVPMFRHSLFAQHFMPTLLLLTPLARVFDSPQYLIAIQTIFYAAAAFVFYRLAARHTSPAWAAALTIAFLFSRRTHSALTSYFYIESALPMLVFGAVLAWSKRQAAAYWAFTLLALGCKEDVALYFAAFGIMLATTGRDRRLGIATAAVSIVWLIAALTIWIPHWRAVYDLDATNPFIDARYGTAAGGVSAGSLAARLLSFRSIAKIITVTSATGFLCFLAPAWLAVTVPGIAANLAAAPGTLQAGLTGHYLWPILPWLFVAAIFGSKRLPARPALSAVEGPALSAVEGPALSAVEGPALSAVEGLMRWAPIATVVIALIDVPLPRAIVRAAWKQPAEAREVVARLAAIPADATIVAQPNLIPHMQRSRRIHALGVYSAGQPSGDYVLLTDVGDLWPLDERSVVARARELAADPAYEQVSGAPLWIFRRR